MKKVFGYCRISTEIQKKKDNSIKNQIKYINDYCEYNKMELVKIFKDEGISGLKSDRDGLNKMFEEIKKSNVEVLCVYSLSRLGRKLKDVIGFVEKLSNNGIQFISIKENFTYILDYTQSLVSENYRIP